MAAPIPGCLARRAPLRLQRPRQLPTAQLGGSRPSPRPADHPHRGVAGIAWRARREELRRQAEPLLAIVACEAEQATDAMALRAWPGEILSPAAAQQRLREAVVATNCPSRPPGRCWRRGPACCGRAV